MPSRHQRLAGQQELRFGSGRKVERQTGSTVFVVIVVVIVVNVNVDVVVVGGGAVVVVIV